jgi:hypothetical protein
MQNTWREQGNGNNSVWNYSLSDGNVTVPGIASSSQITGVVDAPYTDGISPEMAFQSNNNQLFTYSSSGVSTDMNQGWIRGRTRASRQKVLHSNPTSLGMTCSAWVGTSSKVADRGEG